jgi:hypothetical protein
VRVLLLPRVERGLGDPQLPTHVADRGSALGLAQCVGTCSSEEFERFIGPVLSCGGPSKAPAYSSCCRRFRARRHLDLEDVTVGPEPMGSGRLQAGRERPTLTTATRAESLRSPRTPRAT